MVNGRNEARMNGTGISQTSGDTFSSGRCFDMTTSYGDALQCPWVATLVAPVHAVDIEPRETTPQGRRSALGSSLRGGQCLAQRGAGPQFAHADAVPVLQWQFAQAANERA